MLKEVCRAWRDPLYRRTCEAVAKRAAMDEPSDPFKYNRLIGQLRMGVMEPKDIVIRYEIE